MDLLHHWLDNIRVVFLRAHRTQIHGHFLGAIVAVGGHVVGAVVCGHGSYFMRQPKFLVDLVQCSCQNVAGLVNQKKSSYKY